MVGGAIPGLVVLDSIRTWAEQVMESKLVNSTPPWPVSITSCLWDAALFEILS